jgi:drug/metabolite transporter (DMT)-like permease
MYKVIALIVAGIILASSGVYLVSIGAFPILQLPNVNWAGVGFVMVIGSAVTFGTAFIASRIK